MNNITHIALVLDSSISMRGLESAVIEVVNNQVAYWAKKSQEWNDEMRISLYTFDSSVKVHLYDMDVLRVPNINKFYKANGSSTNIIDGMHMAVSDLLKVPEIHAKHQFVAYCFTDGEHNHKGIWTEKQLETLLTGLADNYTVAAFVPGANAKMSAKRFGFPAGNIEIWDTTKKGVEEVGEKIKQGTDALIRDAKAGVSRGSKSLFTLNTAAINKTVVQKLDALNPKDYTFLHVRKDGPIKEFVESWKMDFRQGANYYQLMKPEKIQANKHICIREKKNGKVYTGDQARKLLGLPDVEVKVGAVNHPLYDIFVQSSSVNRKLIAGTELLVMV